MYAQNYTSLDNQFQFKWIGETITTFKLRQSGRARAQDGIEWILMTQETNLYIQFVVTESEGTALVSRLQVEIKWRGTTLSRNERTYTEREFQAEFL